MALKTEIDCDIGLNEHSLDNSADSEFLGMVDEGSFGSADDRSQLVSQSFLDTNEEENTSSSYNFRDLSGSVTYKIVQMAGEETGNGVSLHSPSHNITEAEFYVIENPVGMPMDVYGTSTTQKKVIRKAPPLPSKATTTKKANKPAVTPYYRENKLNTNSVLLPYEMRDDKRRATHNEVERRRRDKINSWITKLAALVPNSGLADSASKGGILAKACDHITELTAKQKRLDKLEVDNDKLVLEILRLNQELTELRKENNSMRSQLADNCIVVNQRPKGQKS